MALVGAAIPPNSTFAIRRDARGRADGPVSRLGHRLVETMGLEPTTPALQTRCSSQLSYVPRISGAARIQANLGEIGSLTRGQSSFNATALGVTFILGSYSAS